MFVGEIKYEDDLRSYLDGKQQAGILNQLVRNLPLMSVYLNYTTVKYGETFNDPQTILTPSLVKTVILLCKTIAE